MVRVKGEKERERESVCSLRGTRQGRTKISILEAQCVQYEVESEAEEAAEHRAFNSAFHTRWQH